MVDPNNPTMDDIFDCGFTAGFLAGIEAAAKWHEQEAVLLRRENQAIIDDGGWPDHDRLGRAHQHEQAVAAIRKLKPEDHSDG